VEIRKERANWGGQKGRKPSKRKGQRESRGKERTTIKRGEEKPKGTSWSLKRRDSFGFDPRNLAGHEIIRGLWATHQKKGGRKKPGVRRQQKGQKKKGGARGDRTGRAD